MTEPRKARIAFVGAGAFATYAHYPIVHLVPEIDLVAICDIDRAKAAKNARNFGAIAVYTDIEEMLDKEQPDGVFCIGPAPQQYELAPKMLRRGIPVYVQKPSAVTSAQARELAELAEKHNTWGQVGFMKRFSDIYTMAREVIAKPEFGPVHELKIKFAQGPYPQLWGIDSANRSMLIGQLCHIFDLSRFLGGEVESVSAIYKEVTPTQFGYIVMAKYSSGAIGYFDLNSLESKTAFRDMTEEVQVVGFESHLICRDMHTLEWQAPEDWSASVPRTGRYLHSYQPAWSAALFNHTAYGYTGEMEHFAKRCLGQAEGGPDLWDSAKSLEIGEAIYQSAHGSESMVRIGANTVSA